jgi:hypothetical protein
MTPRAQIVIEWATMAALAVALFLFALIIA